MSHCSSQGFGASLRCCRCSKLHSLLGDVLGSFGCGSCSRGWQHIFVCREHIVMHTLQEEERPSERVRVRWKSPAFLRLRHRPHTCRHRVERVVGALPGRCRRRSSCARRQFEPPSEALTQHVKQHACVGLAVCRPGLPAYFHGSRRAHAVPQLPRTFTVLMRVYHFVLGVTLKATVGSLTSAFCFLRSAAAAAMHSCDSSGFRVRHWHRAVQQTKVLTLVDMLQPVT